MTSIRRLSAVAGKADHHARCVLFWKDIADNQRALADQERAQVEDAFRNPSEDQLQVASAIRILGHSAVARLASTAQSINHFRLSMDLEQPYHPGENPGLAELVLAINLPDLFTVSDRSVT